VGTPVVFLLAVVAFELDPKLKVCGGFVESAFAEVDDVVPELKVCTGLVDGVGSEDSLGTYLGLGVSHAGHFAKVIA